MTRAGVAAMALLLAACGSAPTIKTQVLTPPPSAPRAQFYVEKPEVQSRETGDAAWHKNDQYGRALTDALKAALRDKGKTIVAPPADLVRTKIYLAYEDVPIPGKPGKYNKAHVEVRLQLVDTSGTVRYSTHTQAVIEAGSRIAGWFGSDAPTPDEIIRAALETAARDFASRL
jgi:uncharacterized lipoprotein YmbA